jgi:hypothetical protein
MLLAPVLLVGTFVLGQPQKPAAEAPKLQAKAEWKVLDKNLWFDPKTKQLIMRAKVVFREGPLEHLVCKEGTKEHESILTTAAPPKLIHAGLLLTGAEPGHPVRFEPKFEPPAGSTIDIRLEWVEGGKIESADARSWVFDPKTKAALTTPWVFAGSDFFVDPVSKEKFYGADDGDLITVANFPAAILDLPFRSNASDADRLYTAHTKVIPERGTEVFMYFAPKSKGAKK